MFYIHWSVQQYTTHRSVLAWGLTIHYLHVLYTLVSPAVYNTPLCVSLGSDHPLSSCSIYTGQSSSIQHTLCVSLGPDHPLSSCSIYIHWSVQQYTTHRSVLAWGLTIHYLHVLYTLVSPAVYNTRLCVSLGSDHPLSSCSIYTGQSSSIQHMALC